MEFRVFSNGNILSRIDFGVFKLLDVDLSMELGQIIRCGHVKIAIPALQAKFRIHDGIWLCPE
jgi:hypothetical protein